MIPHLTGQIFGLAAGYVLCSLGITPLEAGGLYLGSWAVVVGVSYWLANIEAFSARRHRRRM